MAAAVRVGETQPVVDNLGREDSAEQFDFGLRRDLPIERVASPQAAMWAHTAHEALPDAVSRDVRAALSAPVEALYPQLGAVAASRG